MAEWLRRLTRKPKVRVAVGSNPALDSLVAVRNSSPGRPVPCEGNLVAGAGSCGGLMVKHPWPLLEISLSDFRRLATLNIIPTYLPTCEYSTAGEALTKSWYLNKEEDQWEGIIDIANQEERGDRAVLLLVPTHKVPSSTQIEGIANTNFGGRS